MPTVCYDCKLGYGHPLVWCPGCGRRMIKVDTKPGQWDQAKAAGWRVEGDVGLYEYFLGGVRIDQPYRSLVAAVRAEYPEMWERFELRDYDGSGSTPKCVKFHRYDRDVKMAFESERATFMIKRPRLVFRLVGSMLPIDDDFDSSKPQPFNVTS